LLSKTLWQNTLFAWASLPAMMAMSRFIFFDKLDGYKKIKQIKGLYPSSIFLKKQKKILTRKLKNYNTKKVF